MFGIEGESDGTEERVAIARWSGPERKTLPFSLPVGVNGTIGE